MLANREKCHLWFAVFAHLWRPTAAPMCVNPAGLLPPECNSGLGPANHEATFGWQPALESRFSKLRQNRDQDDFAPA